MKRNKKASRTRKYRFLGVALAIALVLSMIPAAAMAMELTAEDTLAPPIQDTEVSPDASATETEETPNIAETEISEEATEQADTLAGEATSTEEAQQNNSVGTSEDIGITPYWASSVALNFHSNYGGPDDLVRFIVPTTTPFTLPGGNSLFGRPADSEYGIFLGWSSNPAQGSAIDIGTAGESVVLNNLSPDIINAIELNGVYAQWGLAAPPPPTETVTVSFEAGEGGEIRQSGATVFTLQSGSLWGDAGITVPTDLIPDLGNVFSHWELDGVEANPNEVPADEAVTADRAYIAVFKPLSHIDELISISFEADGNGLLKNNWSPYQGAKGTEWGKLVERVPKTVASYGHVFAGWELNGVPSDPLEIAADQPINESRTYKAVFNIVEEHSVPITIKAQDAQLEWNGRQQTVTVGGSVVAGSLAEGHTLETMAEGSGLEAGTYSIVLKEYAILDEEGRDVSWEYDIKPENGTLTIQNNQQTTPPPIAPGTIEPPVSPEAPDEALPPTSPEAPGATVPPASPEVPGATLPPASPEVPGATLPPASPEVPGATLPPASPEAPGATLPPASPEVPDAAEPPVLPEDSGANAPGQVGQQSGNTPPQSSEQLAEAVPEAALNNAAPMAMQEQSPAATEPTGVLSAVPEADTSPADAQLEALGETPIPLGEITADSWALMNLLLTIITGVAAIFMALSAIKRRRSQKSGNSGIWLAWLPAAISIALLVATQNPNGVMVMTDGWTIWFLIVAISQAVIALFHKKEKAPQQA